MSTDAGWTVEDERSEYVQELRERAALVADISRKNSAEHFRAEAVTVARRAADLGHESAGAINATLALAAEQYTANLIAYWHIAARIGSTTNPHREDLQQQIRSRLGLLPDDAR